MDIIGDFSQLGDDPQENSSRDDFDDAGLGDDLRFDGAENLASPEAGPSRLPMTPATSSFTPLPRSVLSAFGRRPAFTPERSASPVRNEVADDRATEGQATSGQSNNMTSADAVVSEHFDPPGLFSTSIEKIIQAQTAAVPLEKSHSGNDSKENENGASASGLLLPDNIILDGLSLADGEGKEGDVDRANLSMEGLHFVDDNISKGVQRYFVPEQTEEETFLATADQSKICQNCKKPGHRSKDCPHVIVSAGGARRVISSDSSVLCAVRWMSMNVGTVLTVSSVLDAASVVIVRAYVHSRIKSHDAKLTPRTAPTPSRGSRGGEDAIDAVVVIILKAYVFLFLGCTIGRLADYKACPSVWRIYRYFSTEERSELQDKKRKATEWAKEALGDVRAEMFCYNCANPGHLGDVSSIGSCFLPVN